MVVLIAEKSSDVSGQQVGWKIQSKNSKIEREERQKREGVRETLSGVRHTTTHFSFNMSSDDKLAAALDLLKRLPPSKTYTYLEVGCFLHPFL